MTAAATTTRGEEHVMADQFDSRGSDDDGQLPARRRQGAGAPGSHEHPVHEHPMVERSDRSRSTWVVLAAAMIVAIAVYAAITLGIAGSG